MPPMPRLGGAGVGTAMVSWIPGSNGQALTGFVIETVFAADGTCVFPDPANPGACLNQPVTAGSNGVPPNSAQVTDLPLGVAVQFLVAASNSFGTSQFSVASAAFSAFVPTPPTAPIGVVATAGNASAQVAWSTPASNGGLPVTSYQVTALLNGLTSVGNMSVAAPATGVNFTGLANGSLYNFTVVATNAAGNSAASLPSNAVTPCVPDVQDIAISMSAPSSSTPVRL